MGVKINKISISDIIIKIQEFLSSKISHYIVTSNPEIVIYAQKDQKFCEIINKADLVIPDGIGLILASKIISGNNGSLTERIQGIDLIYRIAKNFNNPAQKIRIFFLGARDGNAKLAAQKIKKNFLT